MNPKGGSRCEHTSRSTRVYILSLITHAFSLSHFFSFLFSQECVSSLSAVLRVTIEYDRRIHTQQDAIALSKVYVLLCRKFIVGSIL